MPHKLYQDQAADEQMYTRVVAFSFADQGAEDALRCLLAAKNLEIGKT